VAVKRFVVDGGSSGEKSGVAVAGVNTSSLSSLSSLLPLLLVGVSVLLLLLVGVSILLLLLLLRLGVWG